MHIFDVIDEKNFMLYASHVYNNPQCNTVDEFYEDVNRFRYLKRLLRRYHETGDLQERLILNHIIVIYNVFGLEGGHKLTFYKVDRHHWATLKTFLLFLNYLQPEALPHIPVDNLVHSRLKEL